MRDAIQNLRMKGLLITDVHPFRKKKGALTKFNNKIRSVSALDRVIVTRHLALLLRSGVTVDRAFDILARQAKKKYLKKVLIEVHSSIRKGESLASSLRVFPGVFPSRYVAMVQWGEAGGSLSESLDHLATQLEHDRELLSKVRGALMYPLLIVAVMIVVGILMSFLVLPQLIQIVGSFNIELPLPTKIFLFFANALMSYGIFVLAGIAMLAILLAFILQTKSVKPAFHYFLLKLPIFGKIVLMVNLARMNRALSSLIQSGIPIIDSLGVCSEVLGNVQYRNAIKQTISDVREGVQLGTSLSKHSKIVPAMEYDMIQVGEESGNLADVLGYLATFYENEVDQMTKNMAGLIEPILLVVVGLVVGGIVFAVLMPIYQLSQAIV